MNRSIASPLTEIDEGFREKNEIIFIPPEKQLHFLSPTLYLSSCPFTVSLSVKSPAAIKLRTPCQTFKFNNIFSEKITSGKCILLPSTWEDISSIPVRLEYFDDKKISSKRERGNERWIFSTLLSCLVVVLNISLVVKIQPQTRSETNYVVTENVVNLFSSSFGGSWNRQKRWWLVAMTWEKGLKFHNTRDNNISMRASRRWELQELWEFIGMFVCVCRGWGFCF